MVIQRARLVTILAPLWEIVQRNTAFFAYSVRLFITPDTDQTSMNAARWSTSALQARSNQYKSAWISMLHDTPQHQDS